MQSQVLFVHLSPVCIRRFKDRMAHTVFITPRMMSVVKVLSLSPSFISSSLHHFNLPAHSSPPCLNSTHFCRVALHVFTPPDCLLLLQHLLSSSCIVTRHGWLRSTSTPNRMWCSCCLETRQGFMEICWTEGRVRLEAVDYVAAALHKKFIKIPCLYLYINTSFYNLWNLKMIIFIKAQLSRVIPASLNMSTWKYANSSKEHFSCDCRPHSSPSADNRCLCRRALSPHTPCQPLINILRANLDSLTAIIPEPGESFYINCGTNSQQTSAGGRVLRLWHWRWCIAWPCSPCLTRPMRLTRGWWREKMERGLQRWRTVQMWPAKT